MRNLTLSTAPTIKFDEKSGCQRVSFFDESIALNSKYLRLVWHNEDDVTLYITSGIEGNSKEREFKLSDIHLPYNGQVKPLCLTPFVITLLKVLNERVSTTPPTSSTSHKTITDFYHTCLKVIEYLALNGATSIKTSVKQTDAIINELSDGRTWYALLNTKQRFDEQYKGQSLLINGTGKTKNRCSFDLTELKKIIGTAQFNKSINDIPEEIISHLNVPSNLRTPYAYNGNATKVEYSVRYYFKAFQALNALFRNEALSSPVTNPDKLAKEISTLDPERTPTPSVDQVTILTKALFDVLRNKKIIGDLFNKARNLIEDPEFGSHLIANGLADFCSGQHTIALSGTDYHICGFKQLYKEDKDKFDALYKYHITLAGALKAFKGAAANLVLLFTGFRAEEVVGEYQGIHRNDYNYDENKQMTELSHYVSKDQVDDFIKRNITIGPIVGQILVKLDALNESCCNNYTETTSLFQNSLIGTNGGQGSMLELSANTATQNPMRYEFTRLNIDVPTPKQFRRYFAVMYFHQFDNPDIRALQQHYGHDSEEKTEIYVTDPDARQVGKSIQDVIPVKFIPTASQTEDTEFYKIFEDARSEKLLSLVQNALDIKSYGSFQRVVRAIYGKIHRDTVYSELNNDVKVKQAKDLAKHLEGKGYRVEVYDHGNCTNSEDIADFSEGKCTNKSTNEIEREHASGVFCQGCAYHDVQPQNIKNLVIQKEVLESKLSSDSIDDIFSGSALTPLEIEQTKGSINDLKKVISQYQEFE
ncbi:hypothetical protein A9Q75_11315 [Colwellia psychrerythraea]|uniref:Uncharacterized protein n=1 Tax=Colwellia psychrerythraea TaxID=28229 RepID=A0A1Y5ECE8_COLPS|nr:hypothetical protein A9Q75_11315 [Colwellia psychrerythraea]